MDKNILTISNLYVNAGDKEILAGVDLEVGYGQTHVLMGPNGTGKSTLGLALMGSPKYEITKGNIVFDGEDITEEGETMDLLGMDESYAERDLNVGFSGGEKKKAEILQLLMLEPKLAILDETDSGLDVDAVRIVSSGISEYQRRCGGSLLVITHSMGILDSLHVDRAHVMVEGRIVKTGGSELIEEVNSNGYSKWETE